MRNRFEWIQDWEALARKARHKAASVAKLSNVSLRHLERFYRTQFTVCLHEWLIDTRLRHAIALLAQGQTQNAVAADVGFVGIEPASALCHFFKQHTGLSPAKYLDHIRCAQRNFAPGDMNGQTR